MRKNIFSVNTSAILLPALLLAVTAATAQNTYDLSEQSYVRGTSEKVYTPADRSQLPRSGTISAPGYDAPGIGDNWFLTLHGGVSSFIGSPTGCNDLFGRNKFSFSAGLGKWLSPYIGLRASYTGNRFKDSGNEDRNYYSVRGDILWNVTNYMRPDLSDMPRWDIIPFLGFGEMRNTSLKKGSFALTPGITVRTRIADRLYLKLEGSMSFTRGDFDGAGSSSAFADKMLNVTVGLTYNIGGNRWKKRGGSTLPDDFPDPSGEVQPLAGHNNYDGYNRLQQRLHPELSDGGNSSLYESQEPDSAVATVIFYFRLGSTRFEGKGQMINLRNIAKTIMKNGYTVRVLAAADSRTGTRKGNRSLAIKRGKKMRTLLMDAGVPKSRIRLFQRGGIDLYKPYPLNRQAIVTLYK